MPFNVLPGGGDVVIIGQNILGEKFGIDVMAQFNASVLNVQMTQRWRIQLVLWATPTLSLCCGW